MAASGRLLPVGATVDYQRSCGRRAAGLGLCLLCDLKGVIDLDPEIPYSAFELGMSEQ
jgi:hypothetical protein